MVFFPIYQDSRPGILPVHHHTCSYFGKKQNKKMSQKNFPTVWLIPACLLQD